MSIGQNTFWVIVKFQDNFMEPVAMLRADDSRQCWKFTSQAAAEIYISKLPGEPKTSYEVLKIAG